MKGLQDTLQIGLLVLSGLSSVPLIAQPVGESSAGQVIAIEGKWRANGQDLKKGDLLSLNVVVRFGGRSGAEEAHILVAMFPSKHSEWRECKEIECSPAPILVSPSPDSGMQATYAAMRQIFRAWREKPVETKGSISRADSVEVSDGLAFFEGGKLRFEGVFPSGSQQLPELSLELVAPYPGTQGALGLRPVAPGSFTITPVPGIYRLYSHAKQKPDEAGVVLLPRSQETDAHAKSLAAIRKELDQWGTAQARQAARSLVRGYLYSLLSEGK